MDQNNGGGWKGKDSVQNAEKFVTDLASALCYVDSRSVDEKFKIPVIFSVFFGRSLPENYKNSRHFFFHDCLIFRNSI